MKKPLGARATERRDSSETVSEQWIDNEVLECRFQDASQGKCMRQLLERPSCKVGTATPRPCQDWANRITIDRLFSNEGITRWTSWPVNDNQGIQLPGIGLRNMMESLDSRLSYTSS